MTFKDYNDFFNAVMPKTAGLYPLLPRINNTFHHATVIGPSQCLDCIGWLQAVPIIMASQKDGKIEIHAIHHLAFANEDKESPRDAAHLFGLLGSSPDAPVVKIPRTAFVKLFSADKAVKVPDANDFISTDILGSPDLQKFLALKHDDSEACPKINPTAAFIIPPFFFSSFASFQPTDMDSMLMSLLHSIKPWINQNVSKVQLSAQQILDESLPTLSMLWLLMRAGRNLLSPTSNAELVGILHPTPGMIVEAELPPELVHFYREIRERTFPTTLPPPPPTMKSTPPPSQTTDPAPPKRVSPEQHDLTLPTPQTMSPLAPPQQLTQIEASLLRALEATSTALESKNKEHIDYQPKGTDKETKGFDKELSPKKRLLLNMATPVNGLPPTEPSEFLTKLFSQPKSRAYELFKTEMKGCPVDFHFQKPLSWVVREGVLVTDERHESISLSLCIFASKTRALSFAESYVQEKSCENGTDRAELLKSTELHYEFPSCAFELAMALTRYGHFFDKLAGTETLIGNQLSRLSGEIMGRLSLIDSQLQRSVDAIAHLTNCIDQLIDFHLQKCESTSFNPTKFPSFDGILADIDFGQAAPAGSMPEVLRKLLPSVRYGGTKTNAAHTTNHQDKGPAKKKIAVEDVPQERVNVNAFFDPDLEVPADQFNTIFPQAVRKNAPKGKQDGQTRPLCLKFYTLGKCTFPSCRFVHNRISNTTKKALKEYVQERIAAAASS